MKPIQPLLSSFLVGVMLVAIPARSVADRLYTWTDERGVAHVTQHPPPATAKNKDVIDYSRRTDKEQQAAAAGSKQETVLQGQAEQVLSGSGKSVEQYGEEIRQDLQKKAAEGKHTCYLQAPDQRVYVRVFSTNSYNEREKKIWDGWIEPNQQVLIISPTVQVLYNSKWEEKGPFGDDNLRACSEGGLIQIPGI